MTRTTMLCLTALGLAAAAGCYTGPGTELSPATQGPATSVEGTEPPGSPNVDPKNEEAAAAASGIPCDVAKVLATSCIDCHGRTPRNGAPNSLVTYEDLTKPSDDDPKRSVAQLSLDRMRSARRPMPPDSPASASDIATLEQWITAGAPKGTCGAKPGNGGGDGGSGGTDAAPDATGPGKDGGAPAPTVCTSGTTWPAGTPASPLMLPGKACIACHSANQGPAFTIAGTVYPTLHEPDSCNGATSPNLTVVIVDAAGKTHTMPVNAAGNFIRVTGIPMPYKAMVVDGTKTREMKTAQTDGDCNGCHSTQGNHAPGRILAP